MFARRAFLATALGLAGVGRRLRAQVAAPPLPVRYAPLSRSVLIPVNAVAAPWQPVPFVAEATRSDATGSPKRTAPRRVLISGVLFRTDKSLSALCVTCPHEQCQVDLVTDEARLARMIDGKASHPLFECACHLSVFDAGADGARISGETPRGLYRFRIAGIRDGDVEIHEIEEVALSQV
jgi:Rieske Fe-S protein